MGRYFHRNLFHPNKFWLKPRFGIFSAGTDVLVPAHDHLDLAGTVRKLFDHDKAVYISVTAFTCTAALFDFPKTLPAALRNALHLDGILALAQKCLPLFSLNLGWILPAIIGFIVGLSIRALRKHRKP